MLSFVIITLHGEKSQHCISECHQLAQHSRLLNSGWARRSGSRHGICQLEGVLLVHGPLPIFKVINPAVVRFWFPQTMRLHSAFHSSWIKHIRPAIWCFSCSFVLQGTTSGYNVHSLSLNLVLNLNVLDTLCPRWDRDFPSVG